MESNLNDPATGSRASVAADVEFSSAFRRIFSYLSPYYFYLSIAFIGFGLFALSQPAFAFLMEAFVNALDGKFVDGLYLIPLACVAIAFVRGIGSYLGSYYMSKASQNMIHDVRVALFGDAILMPLQYFDRNKTGKIISLFTYNANVMSMTISQAFTTLIREGLTVIALFSYLIYQNYKLTIIFFLLGPPIALLINWIGKKVKKLGHDIQAIAGELNHVISEVFGGIRLVKAAVAENSVSERFEDVSGQTKKIGLKLAKVNSIYTPLMQMMVVMGMAVVMYVVLRHRDSMDPAALIAYVTAAALLPKPIRSLSGIHPQILQGIVASQEVFKLIDANKERDTGVLEQGITRGEIEFRSVCFSYAGADGPVLQNLGFHVPAGHSLALVGQSGGGKSTVANLIPRFYDVAEGQILIDGIDLRDFRLQYLRKKIAVVSQNVTLFNASIAENIAFGSAGASRADIERAAEAANASGFISALPQGYDTQVGENGVLLSGGQRQRIAIARAILSDAPILILDEATSALDNESEIKVQAALETAMENRTTIVIAHRLSTIEHCDQIIVLENGKIIESGSHQALMGRAGNYAKMVQRDFTS